MSMPRIKVSYSTSGSMNRGGLIREQKLHFSRESQAPILIACGWRSAPGRLRGEKGKQRAGTKRTTRGFCYPFRRGEKLSR